MPFGNYAQLQQAISDWAIRPDLLSLSPDFIRLAEVRLNLEVRTRDMWRSTTITMTNLVGTVDAPEDLVQIDKIWINTNPTGVVEPRPSSEGHRLFGNSIGRPLNYDLVGNQLVFFPTPDAAYNLVVEYYQEIPALSENTTNWLLTKYPNLYLFAALCEMHPYAQDLELTGTWEQRYQQGLALVNGANQAAKSRSGPFIMRPV